MNDHFLWGENNVRFSDLEDFAESLGAHFGQGEDIGYKLEESVGRGSGSIFNSGIP